MTTKCYTSVLHMSPCSTNRLEAERGSANGRIKFAVFPKTYIAMYFPLLLPRSIVVFW